MPGRALALIVLCCGCGGLRPEPPRGEALALSGAKVHIWREGRLAAQLEASQVRVADGVAEADSLIGRYPAGTFSAQHAAFTLKSSALTVTGDVRATWHTWTFSGAAFRFHADGTVTSDAPFRFADDASGAWHEGGAFTWDPPAGQASLSQVSSVVFFEGAPRRLEAVRVDFDDATRRADLHHADAGPPTPVWFTRGRVGTELEAR